MVKSQNYAPPLIQSSAPISGIRIGFIRPQVPRPILHPPIPPPHPIPRISTATPPPHQPLPPPPIPPRILPHPFHPPHLLPELLPLLQACQARGRDLGRVSEGPPKSSLSTSRVVAMEGYPLRGALSQVVVMVGPPPLPPPQLLVILLVQEMPIIWRHRSVRQVQGPHGECVPPQPLIPQPPWMAVPPIPPLQIPPVSQLT